MSTYDEINEKYESRDLSDDSSRGGSVGNNSRTSRSSRTSVSEIAGQRLYQNALDTQKMIDEKARERSKVPKRTLNLATRGRRSREPSPMPGTPPRYLQLYEYAKTKQSTQTEVEILKPNGKIRDASPSTNESCERLYSLSLQKQQEGRERRNEIQRSKEKPPLPESHFKKISPSEATKLYDRGMKHIVSLELKRMEAAFEMEEDYVSPLVPKSKAYEEDFCQ